MPIIYYLVRYFEKAISSNCKSRLVTNRIIWSTLGKVTWFLIWTAAEKTPQQAEDDLDIMANGNTIFWYVRVLTLFTCFSPFNFWLFIFTSKTWSVFDYFLRFSLTSACHSYPVRDNSPSYSAINCYYSRTCPPV